MPLRRDPALVDAGTEGERLVARVRLGLLCLLLLAQAVPSADPVDYLVGFSMNVVSMGLAVVVYFLATYRYKPWLGFASSGLDVT
jgi:hypothetical protein